MSATPVRPGAGHDNHQEPEIKLVRTNDYRENYANSVQLRMSLWDFQMVFGTIQESLPERVVMENFQGIYLSPQQAKALHRMLGENLAQYEQAFGKVALEPVAAPVGGVN